MEVKNNKTLLYVILGVIVVFLVGITIFVLLNKKPTPVDNNTPKKGKVNKNSPFDLVETPKACQ